ncbi:family 43 glycosylhydrolase [Streptomyces sp. NPDC096048]|uniref:family 43 glycosylhydrolase n=1 Tax=Streptomyces sp. NPDC096048 TaxID=3366072 RepID=UPI003809432D
MLTAALLLPAGRATADSPAARATTYSNPVTAGTVDTFPDPAIIRGKDGYWYAYGTQNPVFQDRGEDGERTLPILRSEDMTHWTYAGEVFTPATQPSWHAGSRLWAPDIRYASGSYQLTYSVAGGDTVGLATAPTPTGPWTDKGAMLPKPTGCATYNIDQAQFTDTDGVAYMYWGSYDTICVAKLNGDRTRIEDPAKEVAKGRRMEGGYVVRHDDYYYLMYSDAACCDGAYSGYQVKAGRSTSALGPFTDDEGVDLLAPTSKGAIVAGANGNRWIGPGHHSQQTDLSGQDWLVYHAVPVDAPEMKRIDGVERQLARRPMLIDRLDWIDGWPVLRAGAGPSQGPQPAPVTTWDVGGTFNAGLGGWRRAGAAQDAWRTSYDPDARGYASHSGAGPAPAFLVTRGTAPAHVRAEADLKVTSRSGSAALVVAYKGPRDHVAAWLDRDRGALVTEVVGRGEAPDRRATALPENFDWDSWHTVVAELRGTRLSVEVTEDRLDDPLAVQAHELPAGASWVGKVGTAARGGAVAADNVGAAKLYTPVESRVPEPRPGRLLPGYSDEFDGAGVPGTSAGSPWSWVRGPAAGASLGDGVLSWPTQNAELNLGTNTASVLTRPAPQGDYMVETRLRFAPEQPFQQAGLVLYGDDDRFFKHVRSVLPLAHSNGAVTRVSEFGKEGPRPTTDPPLPVASAPMFGGPTADIMWLRLRYHTDTVNQETEVRAATSRDGEHWVWSGVWTLPGTGDYEIGLVSMSKAGVTAAFDYVRTYRSSQ